MRGVSPCDVLPAREVFDYGPEKARPEGGGLRPQVYRADEQVLRLVSRLPGTGAPPGIAVRVAAGPAVAPAPPGGCPPTAVAGRAARAPGGRCETGSHRPSGFVPGQPHWQGAPDWHPQPQPDPQPHAATSGRCLLSVGWSDSRACVGSGVVPGDSAMVPSSEARQMPSPIPCPFRPAHQRRIEASARPARPPREPGTGRRGPTPPRPWSPAGCPAAGRPRARPSPGRRPAWRPPPRGRRTARSTGPAG